MFSDSHYKSPGNKNMSVFLMQHWFSVKTQALAKMMQVILTPGLMRADKSWGAPGIYKCTLHSFCYHILASDLFYGLKAKNYTSSSIWSAFSSGFDNSLKPSSSTKQISWPSWNEIKNIVNVHSHLLIWDSRKLPKS